MQKYLDAIRSCSDTAKEFHECNKQEKNDEVGTCWRVENEVLCLCVFFSHNNKSHIRPTRHEDHKRTERFSKGGYTRELPRQLCDRVNDRDATQDAKEHRA